MLKLTVILMCTPFDKYSSARYATLRVDTTAMVCFVYSAASDIKCYTLLNYVPAIFRKYRTQIFVVQPCLHVYG